MPRSWIAFACVVAVAGTAHAFDNGQYGEVPDNIRSWFKSVQQPERCAVLRHRGRRTARPGTGAPATIATGFRIEGEWMPVPPEAVVYDAGNPTGEAVVWYLRMQGNPLSPDQSQKYFIRCFVPGGGV